MLAEQPSPNSPEPETRNRSQQPQLSDRSSPDIGDEPTRKMEGHKQRNPERTVSGGWHGAGPGRAVLARSAPENLKIWKYLSMT